uniref:Serpentine receptor class gamma n=1 Tax=Panagrellus redivivus TaxID=6233 RepID=A0A7E4ZXG2_PANRE
MDKLSLDFQPVYCIFDEKQIHKVLETLPAMAIPLAPTVPLWTECFSIYLDEYGGVSWDHQIRPAWSNSNSAMLMFILNGMPSFTLNVWMCAKLIGSSPNLIKTTRADKRLWILTLSMFIFTFFHTSIQFLFNIDGVSDYYFEIMHVQVVLFDITTLLPSWIILWTSASFRRQVLSMMSFYKVQLTETEDTHSNVQSITNQNWGNMLF